MHTYRKTKRRLVGSHASRYLRFFGGVGEGEVGGPCDTDGGNKGLAEVSAICKYGCGYTYNLELNRHKTEVDDLHSWPDYKVRLQRWDVDVLELARHSALSTAFGNGHEREEAR